MLISISAARVSVCVRSDSPNAPPRACVFVCAMRAHLRGTPRCEMRAQERGKPAKISKSRKCPHATHAACLLFFGECAQPQRGYVNTTAMWPYRHSTSPNCQHTPIWRGRGVLAPSPWDMSPALLQFRCTVHHPILLHVLLFMPDLDQTRILVWLLAGIILTNNNHVPHSRLQLLDHVCVCTCDASV